MQYFKACTARNYFFKKDDLQKMYKKKSNYLRGYGVLNMCFSRVSENVGTCFLWCFDVNDKIVYGHSVKELSEFLRRFKEIYLDSEKGGYTRRFIIYLQKAQDLFYYIVNDKNFDVSKSDKSFYVNKNNEVFYFVLNDCFEVRSLDMLSEISIDEESEIIGDPFRIDYEIENKIYCAASELPKEILIYHGRKCNIIYKYIYQLYYLTIKDRKGVGVKDLPLTATTATKKVIRAAHDAPPNYENNLDFQFFCCGYNRELKNVACDGISKNGFNRYNSSYQNYEIENVSSFDYDSFYPYLLLTKKFPAEVHEIQNLSVLQDQLKADIFEKYKEKAYFLEVIFENLDSVNQNCRFLGAKKKDYISGKNVIADTQNKLISAEFVVYRLTALDLINVKKYYNYDSFKIIRAYESELRYLPKWFRQAVVQLYQEKEILKPNKNRSQIDRVKYQQSKKKLNRIYGILIESPDRVFKYFDNDGNIKPTKDLVKQNDKSHYLYQWGIYVTAHARNILLNWVNLLADDFIYCDVDCIKFFDSEETRKKICVYNAVNTQKIKNYCFYFNYDFELLKNIGSLQDEGTAEKFKVIDLKRYAEIKNNEFSCTVSGLTDEDKDEYFNQWADPKEKMQHFNNFSKFKCFTNNCIGVRNTNAFEFVIEDANGKNCTISETGSIIYLNRDFTFDFAQKETIFDNLQDVQKSDKMRRLLNL